MSPLVGILLGVFFLVDTLVVVAFVVYVGHRHEKLLTDKKPPDNTATNLLGAAMFVQFAMGWSALVLFFDGYFYLYGALKQWHTWRHVSVAGEMLRCDLIVKPDGEGGTTHELNVEYRYRVHDYEYRATVVRHLTHWSDASLAAFVATHAPHTAIDVFYDPDSPADAVLIPGVGGTELFVPLILLPFNLVMLGFWWAGAVYVLEGQRGLSLRLTGVRFFESRARLPRQVPLVGALVAIAIVIMPVILGVCFLGGVPASMPVALSAWGIVLGSALFVYGCMAWQAASGRFDLVVDRFQNTLTLPRSAERAVPVRLWPVAKNLQRAGSISGVSDGDARQKPSLTLPARFANVAEVLRQTIPLADLTAIVVESATDDEKCTRYLPTVHWRGAHGEPYTAKLAAWSDRELAAWLRETIGEKPPALRKCD